jgi:hypothetical protein
MYFLMAARDDPFRSFKPLMAARTMTAAGGWAAGTFGLDAFLAFLGVATFLAGVAATATASDMMRIL